MKDKFNREINYLRISITDKCNLRCVYCFDEKSFEYTEQAKILTDNEIVKIVGYFAKIGIKKVRITGGEPLARPNVVNLISRIHEIDGIEEIYMTTNGVLLADCIYDLHKNGLTGVNISLDSLNGDNFNKITKKNELSCVEKSIEKALELGLNVRINTVLMENVNDNEILDFIHLTKEQPIDLRFIELMPIGAGEKLVGVSNESILATLKSKFELEEISSDKQIKGPAKYIKIKNHVGKVGFISPLSSCFCEECNRIRVTCDGFLKQCLHFNSGISLRDLIREDKSEDDIIHQIMENIFNKPEKHLWIEKEKSNKTESKRMNQIGG